MFLLCVCILFSQNVASHMTSNSSDNENISDVAPSSTSETLENQTKGDTNKTILMERITQPSQTQQIERTMAPESVNSSLKVAGKKETSLESFRPSPHLETYYEYNKYPVKPALGEAKTFGGVGERGHFMNSWTERPLVPPWTEKQHGQWSEGYKTPNSWNDHSNFESNPWTDKPTSTQQPWTSRVKFPSPQDSSHERPYKFVMNYEKSSNNVPATKEDFAFNKPVEIQQHRNTKPSGSFWDRLLGYNINKKKTTPTEPIQKTFFDYNLLEKPPLHAFSKEPLHGLSTGSSPWQSVIKILTTIIPIGLLISALTPTIITVTSVNDTQSRYRVDEHHGIASRLSSSLSYLDKLNSNCRDQVLCELLVSASASKDSQQHIENLLSTFAENEDLKSKKEDLLKVFEAVKNEDCSSILCKSTMHPT